MKTDGCSHQYELNSVKLVEDKINGGAVRLARSPLNDAMDCVQGILSDMASGTRAGSYLEERTPASAAATLLCLHGFGDFRS